MSHDDSPPVAAERAEAIAQGEEGFATETAVVPAPVINQLLKWGFLASTAITVVAIVCLAAFSIYRGQERHTFNATVKALATDVETGRRQRQELQDQVDALSRAAECRSLAQIDLLTVMGDQFASALDRVPPAPDPNAVSVAAAQLRAAVQRCAPP